MWEERSTDLSTKQKPSTLQEQTIHLVVDVNINESRDVLRRTFNYYGGNPAYGPMSVEWGLNRTGGPYQ